MKYIPIISNGPPNMDSLPGQPISDKVTMSDGAHVDNTPEAISAYNQMRKRSEEAARQQYSQRQRANDTGKFCPLHPDAWVNPVSCKKDCALYAFCSALAAHPGKVNTAGKCCPLRRTCNPSCALFNGAGCSLTNFATMAERIEENE